MMRAIPAAGVLAHMPCAVVNVNACLPTGPGAPSVLPPTSAQPLLPAHRYAGTKQERIAFFTSELRAMGRSGPLSRDMAVQMGSLEYLFPDLQGYLMLQDFTFRDGVARLEPPADRRACLIDQLKAQRADLFPEYELSTSLPGADPFRGFKAFLKAYRAGERRALDGNSVVAHCRASAMRVASILILKGIESFPVWVQQITVDEPYTEMMPIFARLCGMLGVHPSRMKALFASPHQGIAGSSFDALLQKMAVQEDRRVQAFEMCAQLSSQQLHRLRMARLQSWLHCVTACLLDGVCYLIDINGQQFGAAFDRVRIVKGQEAFLEGLVMDASLDAGLSQLSFPKAVQLYSQSLEAKQRTIRKAMGLGEHPSHRLGT